MNLFELYSTQLLGAKICLQIPVTTTKSSHQVTGNWVQIKGKGVCFSATKIMQVFIFTVKEGRIVWKRSLKTILF